MILEKNQVEREKAEEEIKETEKQKEIDRLNYLKTHDYLAYLRETQGKNKEYSLNIRPDTSQEAQIHFNKRAGYPLEIVNNKFVSIDFETTGLESEDRIVEVGAVLFENRIPIASYSSLVNPGISIPERASEYNHITDEMISTAPAPNVVMRELISFIDNNTIVAYNADFDIGFFRRELKRLEIEYSNDYYDVYEIVKSYYRGDFPDRKQSTIATYMGIKVENAHRAFNDAEICGKILVNVEPWLEKYEEYDRIKHEEYIKDRTPSEEQRELGAIIRNLIENKNGYHYLVRYKVFKQRLYLHCRKEEIAFNFSDKGISLIVPRKYASNCEPYIIYSDKDSVTIRIVNPFDVNVIENYLLDITNKIGKKYDSLSECSMERVNEEIENSGYEITKDEVPILLKSAKERYEKKVAEEAARKNEEERIKKEKEELKAKRAADKIKKIRELEARKEKTSLEHEHKEQEPKKPRTKPVVQMDDSGNIIKEYISLAEAAKEIGISGDTIRDVCNGRYIHAGGFRWSYKYK